MPGGFASAGDGINLPAVLIANGIGLCLTPDCLLTPRKSVTAILGTADHPVTGTKAGCATCALRTKCAYRKKGTTCATE